MTVRVPRARDRQGHKAKDPVSVPLLLLPPYVRRGKSVGMALLYLYLKGLSAGAFSAVMPVLFGKEVVGFSPHAVLRLLEQLRADLGEGTKQNLTSKNYVCV